MLTFRCFVFHYLLIISINIPKGIHSYMIIYLNAKVSQLLLKCYYLVFDQNIVLCDIVISHYLLSKAEGQTNQSRLSCAFVNVNYVNVKPSIFDVIGRLSTTEHQ